MSKPVAALVVNPNAGRLTMGERDRVVDAFRHRFEGPVVATAARGTGIDLARRAVEDGIDLVVAFGGDGLVNEVANAVAGSGSRMGVVPGGTMNVFARALAMPEDPVAALEVVAAAPAEHTVPLGRMGERLFTFSAGCGFDAEAAERVERDIPSKRRFGHLFFYWSAFRVLAGSYRHRNPSMKVTTPAGEIDAAMTVVSNAGPYAYLMGRPVELAPRVRLDAGLDVFALRRMRIEALPMYAWRAAVDHDVTKHSDAVYLHDVERVEVSAAEPFARHVDGEPLPPATSATIELVSDAIRVVTPA